MADDCGDYVVVVNARHIRVSGDKALWKLYRHHTGYPGGLKEIPFWQMMEKKPTEVPLSSKLMGAFKSHN